MNSKMQKALRAGSWALDGLDPLVADDDDLAGVHEPDELGVDQIEGAGLGRQHVIAVELAQAQGAEPVGVLDADDFPPAGEHHEGKRALELPDAFHQRSLEPELQVLDQKVQEDLAVHGGLEDRSGVLQLPFQLLGVDDVAVVGHGVGAVVVVNHEGLAVGKDGRARRGVPDMADGGAALEFFELVHVEHVGDQPHALVGHDPAVVDHGDAGAFLPPVLKGVESEIRDLGGLGMAMDAENAAGFPRLFAFVVVRIHGSWLLYS